MASPFFNGPTNNSSVNASGEANNEENFLIPARDGTINVFRSCQKSGTVKKVVVTSSTAAVYVDYGSRPMEHVYSESDWSDESKMREKKSWSLTHAYICTLPPSIIAFRSSPLMKTSKMLPL
jgi:nucleoside-diphosphate-sugar epimerase